MSHKNCRCELRVPAGTISGGREGGEEVVIHFFSLQEGHDLAYVGAVKILAAAVVHAGSLRGNTKVVRN